MIKRTAAFALMLIAGSYTPVLAQNSNNNGYSYNYNYTQPSYSNSYSYGSKMPRSIRRMMGNNGSTTTPQTGGPCYVGQPTVVAPVGTAIPAPVSPGTAVVAPTPQTGGPNIVNLPTAVPPGGATTTPQTGGACYSYPPTMRPSGGGYVSANPPYYNAPGSGATTGTPVSLPGGGYSYNWNSGTTTSTQGGTMPGGYTWNSGTTAPGTTTTMPGGGYSYSYGTGPVQYGTTGGSYSYGTGPVQYGTNGSSYSWSSGANAAVNGIRQLIGK